MLFLYICRLFSYYPLFQVIGLHKQYLSNIQNCIFWKMSLKITFCGMSFKEHTVHTKQKRLIKYNRKYFPVSYSSSYPSSPAWSKSNQSITSVRAIIFVWCQIIIASHKPHRLLLLLLSIVSNIWCCHPSRHYYFNATE